MGNGRQNKKKMRIGIAKTLNYYLDTIKWKNFFNILGYEVVLSEDSNMGTFSTGAKYAANEQCFPVKAFYGHINELAESNVDYIFISQVVAQEKGTLACPKIIGLPMLIKNTMENIPPVITVPINKNDPKNTFFKVYMMALKLCKNPIKAKKALEFFKHEFYKRPKTTMQPFAESKINKGSSKGNIGIIAHGYSVSDTLLNMRLMERINSYGFNVTTINDLELAGTLKYDISKKYFNFRTLHWNYGQKVLAAVDHFTSEAEFDGIIFLTYFGCGIDAFIEEVFKTEVSNKMPYLCITLDEHTGEGGLVTRIEAFLDMILRKEERRCV